MADTVIVRAAILRYFWGARQSVYEVTKFDPEDTYTLGIFYNQADDPAGYINYRVARTETTKKRFTVKNQSTKGFTMLAAAGYDPPVLENVTGVTTLTGVNETCNLEIYKQGRFYTWRVLSTITIDTTPTVELVETFNGFTDYSQVEKQHHIDAVYNVTFPSILYGLTPRHGITREPGVYSIRELIESGDYSPIYQAPDSFSIPLTNVR